MIPTGHTSPIVQAYYNYLFSTYYADTPVNRATDILWSDPFEVLAWGLTLIIAFFLLTYYFYRVHRHRGELYEVTSYAGSLTERNGKVQLFTWAIIAGLFAAGVYVGIRYIILGFLY